MKRYVLVTGEKVTPEDVQGGLEVRDQANSEAFIWTDAPIGVKR